MIIFAIDPGPEKSAYVFWDGKKILGKDILYNNELRELIIKMNNPGTIFLIEKVECYGMPVGETVFETVWWSGRFCELAAFTRVLRKDIKLHFCNSIKAKDGNIIQALKDRFEPGLLPRQRPKGILKGVSKDIWQAFALAVYWWDSQKEGWE